VREHSRVKASGYDEFSLPFIDTESTTYPSKTSSFVQKRWNVQQQPITTLLNRSDISVQPYIPINIRLLIAAPGMKSVPNLVSKLEVLPVKAGCLLTQRHSHSRLHCKGFHIRQL
jgi:hypothetical protein